MPLSPDLPWLAAVLLFGFVLGLFPAIVIAKQRKDAARLAGRQELAADLASLQERLNSREEQLLQQSAELRENSARIDILIQEKTGLAYRGN